jgi:HTH-type transcriptional regulator/antitoxin MqsA
MSQEFEYKGQKIVFDGYEVFECSQCAESFEAADDNKDIGEKIVAFQRRVDGLLLPDQIKRLRMSIGFTQKEFAKVLKVGEKSFTRYERGVVAQSQSMDNQLRLIKSDPAWALEVLKNVGQHGEHCEEMKLTVHETLKATGTGTYGIYGGYSQKKVTMSFSGTAYGNKRDTTS